MRADGSMGQGKDKQQRTRRTATAGELNKKAAKRAKQAEKRCLLHEHSREEAEACKGRAPRGVCVNGYVCEKPLDTCELGRRPSCSCLKGIKLPVPDH